jgi:hypothetical protein
MSCPHIALAWIGFLLSRLLDVLLVALLALLWMGLGWLKASYAAAAVGTLKSAPSKNLTMQNSVFGPKLAKVFSLKLQKFSEEESSQETQQQRRRHQRAAAGQSRLSGLKAKERPAAPEATASADRSASGDGERKRAVQVLQPGVTSTIYSSPMLPVLNSNCSTGSAAGSHSSQISAYPKSNIGGTPSFADDGLGTWLPSSVSDSVNGYDKMSSAPSAALPDPCQLDHQPHPEDQQPPSTIATTTTTTTTATATTTTTTTTSAAAAAAAAAAQPVGRIPTTKHDSRVQTAFKPPLTAIESMESCRQGSDHLDMQPPLTQAESSGPQPHQSTSRRQPRLFNFRGLFSGGLSTGSTGSSGRRRRLQPMNSHLERHKNSGGGSSSNGSKLGTLGSGFYSLTRAPSLGWKAAVRLMQQQQQQQQIDDATGVAAALSSPAQDSLTPAAAAANVSAALSGISDVTDMEIRRVTEEYAALLLVVVRHLACLTQVGLHNFLRALSWLTAALHTLLHMLLLLLFLMMVLEIAWQSHLCPWRSHLCPWQSHLCPWRSHLCPWRSHLCPWRSHLCPWRYSCCAQSSLMQSSLVQSSLVQSSLVQSSLVQSS